MLLDKYDIDSRLAGAIEAMLFVSAEAVPLFSLADALKLDEAVILRHLDYLMEKHNTQSSGINIIRADNCFQWATSPQYYDSVVALLAVPKKRVLTGPLLETLAIIAYMQPVTKPQIEEIRGVNADHAVNKLLEYNLVMECGRQNAPGKPILFGTTEHFLKTMGFDNIEEYTKHYGMEPGA